MKLCANVSWMFVEVPFLERAAAARRAGFGGIEFHSPEGHAASDIRRAASDAGVEIVLFNASPGDFLQGGLGWSGVPGREAQFREAVAQVCELGAQLGGADTAVQIGQSRVPQGVSREECMRVYAGNLRYAAVQLAQVRCRPLVEPMNEVDFPGVLVRDVSSALEAIAAAADSRVGLQFDAYHDAMSGGDVCSTVERLGGKIAHLQISDAPGRHQPGTGRIDFGSLFGALRRQGYSNWLSAEYRPSRRTTETLEWLRSI